MKKTDYVIDPVYEISIPRPSSADSRTPPGSPTASSTGDVTAKWTLNLNDSPLSDRVSRLTRVDEHTVQFDLRGSAPPTTVPVDPLPDFPTNAALPAYPLLQVLGINAPVSRPPSSRLDCKKFRVFCGTLITIATVVNFIYTMISSKNSDSRVKLAISFAGLPGTGAALALFIPVSKPHNPFYNKITIAARLSSIGFLTVPSLIIGLSNDDNYIKHLDGIVIPTIVPCMIAAWLAGGSPEIYQIVMESRR